MSSTTEQMLGVLPPLVLAGGTLMLMERFMDQPQKRKGIRKPFDKQETKDNKVKYGNFSNVGF